MTVSNPYLLGDPAVDRQRLMTQTLLFSDYIRGTAHRLVGTQIQSILDLGCGEGQLGMLLQELYSPRPRLTGVDSDEQAIATARARAQERGLANAEFRVGDAMELDGLAPGSFDLVYISLLLLHLRRPDKAITMAYSALRPGGHIWIKELHPDLRTAIKHPSFKKLGDIMGDTATALGGNSFVSVEVPGMLAAAGFSDVRSEIEYYLLGGPTPEGQATLATILGAMHHARHIMSKMTGVPVSEIERLYLDICNHALRSRKELGRAPYANIVARRPLS